MMKFMNKSAQSSVEKEKYQKIEKIVEEAFDEVSEMVKRSRTESPKVKKIGTIVFS